MAERKRKESESVCLSVCSDGQADGEVECMIGSKTPINSQVR